MTFQDFCDDVENVRKLAIQHGVKGEPYLHYCTNKQGQYTGKTKVKYKPLNNLDLYNFAKKYYAENFS